MGGGVSVVNDAAKRYIKDEFERVMVEERGYLCLSELRLMRPMPDLPINFSHLGVLFMVDRDKNGRVTLDELYEFAEMWNQQSKQFQVYELQSRMEGLCTLKLWKSVVADPGDQGIKKFVDWFILLMLDGSQLNSFDSYPGVQYVNRDTAQLIHEVLNIEKTYGYDSQGFFDLLQRVGEEMGLLKLEDEQLDDAIPLTAVEHMIHEFINGFVKLMSELGFTDAAPYANC